MPRTLPFALLALGAAAVAAPLHAQRKPEPPPGLVLVEGGRTQIGTEVDEFLELVETGGPQVREIERLLAAETPRHTVKVDDFFLMVSEVTNEQYLAYVQATGARPPWHWGRDAVNDVGRKAYFEEVNARRAEAREKGEPYDPQPFNEAAWWERNWTDHAWSVPQAELAHPVVNVSYAEARAYARWAGLRLPTEYEYQRAARGDTDRSYPWGEEWQDRGLAASLHDGFDRTFPVGSFPDGAVGGVFDLAGNVWEWTSSPFSPYEGYKPIREKIGKGSSERLVEPLIPFDYDQRVVVGGCYATGKLSLRSTTRSPVARQDRFAALGFRCAASTTPGADLAQVAWSEDVPGRVLPPDATYLASQATVLQRWVATHPGASDGGTNGTNGFATAERSGSTQEASGAAPARPPGYAVIVDHDALVFVPIAEVDAVTLKQFEEKSVEAGPQHVGVLHTTVPLLEPALAPGTYLVAYRAEGEVPEAPASDDEAAPVPAAAGDEPVPYHEAPGFDPARDQIVLFDAAGSAVATLPAADVGYERMAKGSVAYAAWTPPPPPTEEELEAEDYVPPTPQDTVTFDVAAPGRQRNKGITVEFALALEPGLVDAGWK